MNAILEAARKLTTAELVNGAREANKGEMSEDKRMVRAALIQVYSERCGPEAADKLMDELGM